MIYFESLHPSSPGLTRQVQRAVNALNLPRDENGYFMINKTVEEYKAEQELSKLLQSSSVANLDKCTPVLVKMEYWKRDHMIYLMQSAAALRKLYETIVPADNGVLFYTKTPEKLTAFFSSFIKIEPKNDQITNSVTDLPEI